MADELLFKKYSNRRLYDTEESTYVSLSHVADKIRQGRHVKVIDAKSEEDVTAFILAQIILEEARKKNNLLPIPLLHLIFCLLLFVFRLYSSVQRLENRSLFICHYRVYPAGDRIFRLSARQEGDKIRKLTYGRVKRTGDGKLAGNYGDYLRGLKSMTKIDAINVLRPDLKVTL